MLNTLTGKCGKDQIVPMLAVLSTFHHQISRKFELLNVPNLPSNVLQSLLINLLPSMISLTRSRVITFFLVPQLLISAGSKSVKNIKFHTLLVWDAPEIQVGPEIDEGAHKVVQEDSIDIYKCFTNDQFGEPFCIVQEISVWTVAYIKFKLRQILLMIAIAS